MPGFDPQIEELPKWGICTDTLEEIETGILNSESESACKLLYDPSSPNDLLMSYSAPNFEQRLAQL